MSVALVIIGAEVCVTSQSFVTIKANNQTAQSKAKSEQEINRQEANVKAESKE